MYVIYKITNLINNKIYIGKLSRASDFKNYWGSGLLKEVSEYFLGYKSSRFIKKLKQAISTKTPLYNYIWKHTFEKEGIPCLVK
jgi:hypothetical protein